MVTLVIGGKNHLFVIGGKQKLYDDQAVKTVYKLSIDNYMKTKYPKHDKQSDQENWVEVANMNEARCMFAATVIGSRFVFVYGGLKQSKEMNNEMASIVCERYDSQTNTWAAF